MQIMRLTPVEDKRFDRQGGLTNYRHSPVCAAKVFPWRVTETRQQDPVPCFIWVDG